ncbi:MAG TPA: barstar family protein [Rhodanobacter sp.]|nr:barstar family protein [Rhodanobacter sp.]
MTSKVLGIDLHDAGRDGVYRAVPDDPPTLIDDAARAGLRLLRADLADCDDAHDVRRRLAQAFALTAEAAQDWDTLARRLRDLDGLPVPGYVLLLDHANALHDPAPVPYLAMREMLVGVTKHWHARGVPFFVFMEFPDGETLDAAIDA